MDDLKQYTILITGSASGNGLGIATVCTKYFRKIILIDKDKDNLDIAKEQLNKLIKQNTSCCIIDTYTSDLSDYLQRCKLIENILSKYKVIHCIVNNAGVSLFPSKNASFAEKLKVWNYTIEVNLTATFHIISELNKLIPDDLGTIINITSLNSTLAFPDNPSYMSSKGGLRQLTLSFANDLSKRGIRVNSIAPGYIRTNMTLNSWKDLQKRRDRTNRTMLGRWGKPKDLGGIVCFLASEMSSYITGQEIYIDGGWSTKGL
tara:strand:+ start:377 stop:1159 length:783 start_codon:yes stop_codon:yes gene_type:complete